MKKRSKLEIIQNILKIIQENNNHIKPTPLLRKSNLSSGRFKEYYTEILNKGFVQEIESKNSKFIALTEKGFNFLNKYRYILNFIEEFEL